MKLNKHCLNLIFFFLFTSIVQGQESLIHYWHFNDLPDNDFYEVGVDFSLLDDAVIKYEGTGDGYMDDVDDGSGLNLHLDRVPGTALRVRNPSDTRELIIEAPTTGFKNIVLSYAVKRTTNGATSQELYYSTGGDNWILYDEPFEITPDYQLKEFYFTGFDGVDDNSNLRFRILFDGETVSGGDGNNRFDNITVEGNTIYEEVSYYSQPEGMLNDPDTWGVNPDGSGASPDGFNENNTKYYIHNRDNATIAGDWNIGGIGSVVVAGDGNEQLELIIPEEYSLDGIIDVMANATLWLQNISIPEMGYLDPTSRVVFEQDALVTVPALTYGELHLMNSQKSLAGITLVEGLFSVHDVTIIPEENTGLFLNGNVEYSGVVNTINAQNMNVHVGGDNDQVFDGDGHIFECYNFNAEKHTGTLTLIMDVYAHNNFRMNFYNDALFSDGGRTIQLDDDLRFAGDDASNFDLTGTVLLTASEGTNDFETMTAELNNLIIDVNGEARPDFDLADYSVVIKNDLSIISSSVRPVRLRDKNLIVGGDFLVDVQNKDQIEKGSSRIIFSGVNDQTVTNNGYAGFDVFNDLLINKTTGELIIDGEITFDGNIHFENGMVSYMNGGMLKAGPGATISGFDSTSYINGHAGAYFESGKKSEIVLPVGDTELLRPVEFFAITSDDPGDDPKALYVVELINEPAPDFELTGDLVSVSDNYHYEIKKYGQQSVLMSQIGFIYDEVDQVDDHNMLRIVKSDNGSWVDLGGKGSAVEAGEVHSYYDFEFDGLFTLAVSDKEIVDPVIKVSHTSLDQFVVVSGELSAVQSFWVTGYNLSENIDAEVSLPFLLSLEEEGDYHSSLQIGHTEGSVSPVEVYVVYFPQEVGIHEQQVELSSEDAPTVFVDVAGEAEYVAELYINEFLALNESVIQDPFGNYLGWVEIYNPNDHDVDIKGYFMSNDPEEPAKYEFPAGQDETVIPAGEFLLLWAGGDETLSPLHLDFSIPFEGGMLSLYAFNATTVIDEIYYGIQVSDVSYGREVDGSDDWVFFNEPTPGFSNLLSSVGEISDKNDIAFYPNPVIDGTIYFSQPVSVYLISVKGKIIRYAENATSMDVGNVAPGIYFLRTNDGQANKVIINR